MQCNPDPRDRINSFALVSYIPEPLGGFLDRLRRELVMSCFAKSHVSILPPRPLATGEEQVRSQLDDVVPSFDPFVVELGNVEVFRSTSVIYLGVSAGSDELKRMHSSLNENGLANQESYAYHPHVTLAQDFPPEQFERLLSLANQRWAEFPLRRSFPVESLTFVQNTAGNRWLDLAEFPLGRAVLSGSR